MTEPIEGFPQDLLERLCRHTTRDEVIKTVEEIERSFNLDRPAAVAVIETALKSHEALFLAGLKTPTNSVN